MLLVRLELVIFPSDFYLLDQNKISVYLELSPASLNYPLIKLSNPELRPFFYMEIFIFTSFRIIFVKNKKKSLSPSWV